MLEAVVVAVGGIETEVDCDAEDEQTLVGGRANFAVAAAVGPEGQEGFLFLADLGVCGEPCPNVGLDTVRVLTCLRWHPRTCAFCWQLGPC